MKMKCTLATLCVYTAAAILLLLGVYVMETGFRPSGLIYMLQSSGNNTSVKTHSDDASADALHYPAAKPKVYVLHKKRAESVQQHKEEKSGRVPQERYLLRSFEGRLGNILFQFSSALCIAMLNNLTLIVKDGTEMRSLRYDGVRVSQAEWGKLSTLPVKIHGLTNCCKFNSTVMTLTPATSSHELFGYFQSWKYFKPCEAKVKRATRFQDSIVTKAVKIITDLRRKLPRRTLVGVHVRREDLLRTAEQNVGKRTAPADYFRRAMTYFRDKFRDVTFVVISSDPGWYRTEITNASDVVMLKRSDSPPVDMEVLSRMDHLIISVGTFGWWSAYKSSGTVVYYKDFYVPGSKYGRQFENNTADVFFPWWIPL